MVDQDANLVTVPGSLAPDTYKADLQVFESGLMRFIEQHGLPTANVLEAVS